MSRTSPAWLLFSPFLLPSPFESKVKLALTRYLQQNDQPLHTQTHTETNKRTHINERTYTHSCTQTLCFCLYRIHNTQALKQTNPPPSKQTSKQSRTSHHGCHRRPRQQQQPSYELRLEWTNCCSSIDYCQHSCQYLKWCGSFPAATTATPSAATPSTLPAPNYPGSFPPLIVSAICASR